ncbi:hypothetical protein F8388_025836 [Cannabis sativa]|uniref:PGG domain-containing protein n=1 Tax=Cannabis sativa TaxID=3483 RepID=A0A7J6F9Z8_CANSA|nr:hypothetical protein F8388_025836 [Cannabis sativa]
MDQNLQDDEASTSTNPTTPPQITSREWSVRIALFHAALSGDYPKAERIINNNNNNENPNYDLINNDLLRTDNRRETLLHVAAGANQIEFVKKIFTQHNENINLAEVDANGNTAFFLACATGDIKMVEEFLNMERDIITTSNIAEVSPFAIAVSFGHGEVASYFVDREQRLTPLHFLSRKPPYLFSSPKSTICSKLFGKSEAQEESKALKLVKRLWNQTLELKRYNYAAMSGLISSPFHLLMEATKVGNHDFLVVLISAYPELIWENDSDGKNIFYYAVKYRQVKIFKLIHEVGLSKQVVQNYEDNRKNNLLHLVACKPPENMLRSIVGSALQMREEILWFREVRKIVIPSFRNKMNSMGQTPQDLLTKKHSQLMKESEKWMKKNANICLLVATIIVTIIFQANSDTSNDQKPPPPSSSSSSILKDFLLISNIIAMSSSSIAIMLNLFIIISRFSEDDLFLPLPLAFIIGILSLYVSVIFTMTSFCLTTFMATESLAIRLCACLLEFLPIILFPFLVFPIFIDLTNIIFFSESKFKPTKRVVGWYYHEIENREARRSPNENTTPETTSPRRSPNENTVIETTSPRRGHTTTEITTPVIPGRSHNENTITETTSPGRSHNENTIAEITIPVSPRRSHNENTSPRRSHENTTTDITIPVSPRRSHENTTTDITIPVSPRRSHNENTITETTIPIGP